LVQRLAQIQSIVEGRGVAPMLERRWFALPAKPSVDYDWHCFVVEQKVENQLEKSQNANLA
jgi:hypothetical protein